ncbi:MAG: glycosyltransferase family 9 protein [Ignavibacteria bacterium]
MHEFKKILVVRLSSLGDIILSFPLLNILRKKYPEAEIHFLTRKKFSEVIKLNPNVDKIIETDNDLSITKNKLSDEKYDLILDIHKNFKSIYLTRGSGAEVRRIIKNNLMKMLLVKFKINLFKEIIPVYKKYLLTFSDSLNNDELKFTTSILNFSELQKFDIPYAVISPSSKHYTKTYPDEKFIEFIRSRENETFILTGSSDDIDMEICNKINSECSNTKNLCGELSISELASMINGSEYVICNDSAVLHLSEALNKKTYAIFGSTVKEFGFFPQLKTSEVIEVNGLECRPCSHIGLPECPKKHFKCMKETDLKNYNIN